jgi:hypothetical protein
VLPRRTPWRRRVRLLQPGKGVPVRINLRRAIVLKGEALFASGLLRSSKMQMTSLVLIAAAAGALALGGAADARGLGGGASGGLSGGAGSLAGSVRAQGSLNPDASAVTSTAGAAMQKVRNDAAKTTSRVKNTAKGAVSAVGQTAKDAASSGQAASAAVNAKGGVTAGGIGASGAGSAGASDDSQSSVSGSGSVSAGVH